MERKLFVRVVRSGRPAAGMKVYAATIQAARQETTPIASTDKDGFAVIDWKLNPFLAVIYVNGMLAVQGRFYNGESKLIEIEDIADI